MEKASSLEKNVYRGERLMSENERKYNEAVLEKIRERGSSSKPAPTLYPEINQKKENFLHKILFWYFL